VLPLDCWLNAKLATFGAVDLGQELGIPLLNKGRKLLCCGHVG
jgi:hypothetical protein